MKITATVSGGLAGATQCHTLDTAGAAGQPLEALLARLDFFGAQPACGLGADLQRWEITVTDGARSHTVVLTDDGASGPEWQALIAQLRQAV